MKDSFLCVDVLLCRPKAQVAYIDDRSTDATEQVAFFVDFQRTNWYFILQCNTGGWRLKVEGGSMILHDSLSCMISFLYFTFRLTIKKHGLHVFGQLDG